MEKSYKCVCGKEFKSSQAINGHKANCIEYLKTQFNNAEEILNNRQFKAVTSGKNAPQIRKERSKQNKQNKFDKWLSEEHKCEKCGKVMTEYYGSGRFCSEFCARSVSNYKPEKHLDNLEDFPYKCPICNKGFNNTKSLSLHIAGAHKQDRHMQPVTLYNPLTRLDITVSELENYKHTHDTCEICGRKLDPTVKQSDTTVTYLCIDHIHSTAKFRGLLCGYCNGALGWFEKNKSEVLKYLEVKGEEHY